MANYPKPDGLQSQRSMSEQVRRLQTRRPLRGHVPSLTWAMEGQITVDRYFLPALITVDPAGIGEYPEFKQIIAFDGYSSNGGDVQIGWSHNTGYILNSHTIIGGLGYNRVTLPVPFIIDPDEYGTFGGQFIQPEILAEPAFASYNLSLMAILETVPV